jgi:hypothetical protein
VSELHRWARQETDYRDVAVTESMKTKYRICLVALVSFLAGVVGTLVVREGYARAAFSVQHGEVAVRVFREWKFPGTYNVVAETSVGIVTARTPILVAQDPFSDSSFQSIERVTASSDMSSLLVQFTDGSIASLPLFLGLGTKRELLDRTGHAPSFQQSEKYTDKKAAQPGATDNPDDAQR